MNLSLKERLARYAQQFRASIAEYGAVALVVHYVIFAIVISAFYLAIRAGWTSRSTAGTAGTWGAAYIGAKLTQPLRMLVTVLITPALVRGWKRLAGKQRRSD